MGVSAVRPITCTPDYVGSLAILELTSISIAIFTVRTEYRTISAFSRTTTARDSGGRLVEPYDIFSPQKINLHGPNVITD